MSGSLKPAEFFVLEAGEYLERLATLVAKTDGPKPDELVRYARALRGSALMASQPDFAGAAGGLEAVARAYRDGTLSWSADVRESGAQAVEQLKSLLRHAPQWSSGDTAEAERIARNLGRLAGQPAPPPHRRAGETGQDLNTGVRAFVAREGALIASALERAARALRHDRANMDPVHNVVRRMQSLRGLAELAELSPLPDVLDALELAAGDLTRSHSAPPGVSDVFARGAAAMTRLSRDVADRGVPTPDSEEAVYFTDGIIETFALETDVVEVESLAPRGEAPIVSRGETFRLPEADVASVEMVSHGEHLAELSHGLQRAGSASERRLRLYSLMEALRAMGQRLGPALAAPVASILAEAKRLLTDGIDEDKTGRFATILQQAGTIFGQGPSAGDVASTAARLGAVTEGLAEPAAPSSTPTAPAPPPAAVAEPLGAFVKDEVMELEDDLAEGIIPIADLAPTPTPEPTPPSSANEEPADPFPPSPAEDVPFGVGLAGGLRSYARLRRESPPAPPSIEALVGSAAAPPPPHEGAVSVADTGIVPIEALLYRGEAAWDRAIEVRSILSGKLTGEADLADVRPLLEELIDLLPLAR